ncbi:DNA-binding transcriptional ArsR family regulator [Methanofollis sp. W23]|uniref:helix-turn-helix domain-containing protein n=1 Tax=Methanofollis sp. W23 TaxID=2817849 RepID=UPI001AE10815|nr:helix-turn-helix domain-containing protein [Methanofollis sp. W23]MBP2145319.1 DNA-binding transcriptional ArsR family regulator [Methanofollis sp. W23]
MMEDREQRPAPLECEDGRTRILNLLEEETYGLSISDISRKIGLNRNSVAKYLNMLVVAGRVEMQVVGSARVYRLTLRLPVSAIFPFLPDAAVSIGSDLRVRHANALFCTLFSLEETSVAGMQISETSCVFLHLLAGSGDLKDVVRGTRGGNCAWHLLEGARSRYFVWTVPAVFDDGDYGAIAVVRPE